MDANTDVYGTFPTDSPVLEHKQKILFQLESFKEPEQTKYAWELHRLPTPPNVQTTRACLGPPIGLPQAETSRVLHFAHAPGSNRRFYPQDGHEYNGELLGRSDGSAVLPHHEGVLNRSATT